MRRAGIAGLLWIVLCAPAVAQTSSDRPGPYVLDVHGATASLPGGAAFFPPLPASTSVPSRGFGIDVGAHVYFLQLGPARLGFGAKALRVRGTAPSSTTGSAGSTSDTRGTTPEIAMLFTTVSPQLSANFGSRAGWSYLSAGIGWAEISTSRGSFVDGANQGQVRPALRIEQNGLSVVNFGGGARWFAKSRLAFSFDVRFHLLQSSSGVVPTPGTTLVAVGAGISLR